MTTWQIFAATDIPVSIDYIDPAPDREKLGRTLEYMLDNSYVDFEVDVSTEDQILILSTCTSDEDVRFIIAAKLVKTGNVKRVPLKDGPDPRICYGIFKENESERPQIAAFMKEFIRQAEKMPEIRVLKAAG